MQIEHEAQHRELDQILKRLEELSLAENRIFIVGSCGLLEVINKRAHPAFQAVLADGVELGVLQRCHTAGL